MKKIILIIILTGMVNFLFAGPRYIRVNQVGYLTLDTKIANLFTNDNLTGVTFSVVRISDNSVVYGPQSVGQNQGSYANYSYNYKLDFSSLQTAGTYKIILSDGVTESPQFEIGDCVYSNSIDKILNFFHAQRCGYNPHLNANCHLFNGTSRLDGEAVGGPNSGAHLDVSGGWHDAGDFIKFMITIADSTFMMLFAYQENPDVFKDIYLADGTLGSNGIPDVLDEAKYGLDWIMKMHPSTNEFYYQVGGEEDHNTGWILPQNDNANYTTSPYRPVYHCESGKGANIAGKASAALALAYIIWNNLGDTTYATQCLNQAIEWYNFGKNNQNSQQSNPNDFYGETTWRDDMELGAVELYKATGNSSYLSDAENWAPSVDSAWGWTSWDALNFFAHYELYKETSNNSLKNDLQNYMKSDLDSHVSYANNDMFGMAAEYTWGSQAINTAAVLLAHLYNKLFDNSYINMGTGARDYLLGKNQWGVSFVVGVGSNYPHDPHHNIAEVNNEDIFGMTIEGPVKQSEWNSYGITLKDPDEYSAFQSSVAVYHDDREDYATNEPTIWQAAVTLAMFSFLTTSSCIGTPTYTETFTETYTPTFTITQGGPTFTPTYTPTLTPTGSINYLDDFEDNEFTTNNWGGGWYEWADGTSSINRQIVTDTPLNGGNYAGYFIADISGASGSWASAGIGTNLNASGTAEDLTTTDGLRLYMKGNMGTGTNVEFSIQIVSTNITDYSYWKYTWTPDNTWQFYDIPWSNFSSPGWGEGDTLTLNQILQNAKGIQFNIGDTTGGTVNNTGNEWYIDNIEIYSNSTPTETYTPTDTFTITFTPTNTYTPTNTETLTYTDTIIPTDTYTKTATNTYTPTNTETLTYTETTIPTDTYTETATNTYTPTNTETLTYTETTIPTDTETYTPTFTFTITFTPTNTYTPTETPTGTFFSPTPTDTYTETITFTSTFTPTNTYTSTNTTLPTNTFTSTYTETYTITETPTETYTGTQIPTNTYTYTNTFTYTPTFTNTQTATFTYTHTLTPIETNTNTPTNTITQLITNTYTNTPTYTYTTLINPTYTPTPVIAEDLNITDISLYPNPLIKKNNLTIKFTVNKQIDRINISIYTVAGRLIYKGIFKKDFLIGVNTIVLENKYLQNLANGIYYCVINAKDLNENIFRIVKLMILN